MLSEKSRIKLYHKIHNLKIPQIKFKSLEKNYQIIYQNIYNIDEHDINKSSFLILAGGFPLFLTIFLLFLKINIILAIIASFIISFGISYKLNNYFYKKLKNEEKQLNAIVPLIRIYFTMIQHSLPANSDYSIYFIKLIIDFKLPISKMYRKILNQIMVGESPEVLLNQYITPSNDFNRYVKELISSGFNSVIEFNDNTLVKAFRIFLRQIEAKISIIFFVGLFLPLVFSLLILFQGINVTVFVLFLPIFYLCLRTLYNSFLKKDFHLIGMLKDYSMEEKKQYNEFLSFLFEFSNNLKKNISPETAFTSAVLNNNQIGPIQVLLKHQVSLLMSFESPFNNILINLKQELTSLRFTVILDVIWGIINEDSFNAHKKIREILLVINKHQELEKKLEIIVKGERFKVIMFIFLLPSIIGGIGGIFPIFITTLGNLEINYSFTSEFVIIFISLLITVIISSYYFLKVIDFKKKHIIMINSCFLYIIAFFMCFISVFGLI